MKNINDWIALIRTIESNGKRYMIRIEKIFGIENSYWIARTLLDVRIITYELEKESIKDITSKDILNLDFLINIIKNKNNKIIERWIRELPDVDIALNYQSTTLQFIELKNKILKELLYEYTENTAYKLETNGYEYIVRYNKKDNSYEIRYYDECLKVYTEKECANIYQILEKERLTGQDSLKIAEIMSY